jgi:hypothetical protein
MRKMYLSISILAAISASFYGCNDEDPIIPNEEEVITTLVYTLTPSGGGDDVVLRFEDLDGDGGNQPVVTVDTLEPGTTYTGTVQVLNESESPAEDITEEVKEEGVDHQFFYVSSLSDVTISYSDQDSKGNPIGIQTEVSTGAADVGTLAVVLRHEPNKIADGVKDGDIANAGGESDIEVVFPLYVR